MMEEIHDNYGNLLGTQEKSTTVTVEAGVGNLVVFMFDVEFQKAKATERLTFVRDQSGRMRLWKFELT
jgi:hypothetical protein